MDSSPVQQHDSTALHLLSPEVRKSFLTLWQRTRTDWRFARDGLSAELRRTRIPSALRSDAREALFGMVRHLRRIDAALAAGGLRVGSWAADGERLGAYLVLEGGLSPDVAAQQFPNLDWQAVIEGDPAAKPPKSGWKDLATRHSQPDFIAKRLVADWGDDADALAAALNESAPVTLRVNEAVMSRDEVFGVLQRADIAAVPGKLSPRAIVLSRRVHLAAIEGLPRAAYTLQDEGSQLIAALAVPPPGGCVVDFCAGAGGKSLAIAAEMDPSCSLLATDVFGKRLAILSRRARDAGARGIHTIEIPASPMDPWPRGLERWRGVAQRVLVDAPCTGIGALRRTPELRWRLTPGELEQFPVTQRQIALRAAELLAPGGLLIYATCSVFTAENQRVVAELSLSPSLEFVPLSEVNSDIASVAGDEVLQLLPQTHGTDAFFAAVFRRT